MLILSQITLQCHAPFDFQSSYYYLNLAETLTTQHKKNDIDELDHV